MRGYKFPLEDILNLREDKEQNVMEEMSQIQNTLLAQQKDLMELEEEISSIGNNSYKTIQELRYQSVYKSNLKEKVQEQNERIIQTGEELEESRQELIEAQKDRKVMEKLKEEDKEKYEKETRRIEQNELDEIAVLKFNATNF